MQFFAIFLKSVMVSFGLGLSNQRVPWMSVLTRKLWHSTRFVAATRAGTAVCPAIHKLNRAVGKAGFILTRVRVLNRQSVTCRSRSAKTGSERVDLLRPLCPETDGNESSAQFIGSIMRRYHFHICDGVQIFDSLGTNLPDDQAACAHAKEVADDLTRSKLFDRATIVRVTNDLGNVVFKLPLSRSA
jgi:hypothetical protein